MVYTLGKSYQVNRVNEDVIIFKIHGGSPCIVEILESSNTSILIGSMIDIDSLLGIGYYEVIEV